MLYMYCRKDAKYFDAIEKAHRGRTRIDVIGRPTLGGFNRAVATWSLFIDDAVDALSEE